MAARRLIPSLPLCLLLSSCLPYLGGGPPDENAMFREQQKMVWGEGGEFCAMAFGDRVDPDAFPSFIAEQEKKCAQGDAVACDDEADARLGGCAGTPRDRDRGMALVRRACELGRPEACRAYADSMPSKSWWFFANGEREWADARELELVQQLCAAGDQERCRRLEQRRRAGGAGARLSQSAQLQ